MSILPPEFVDLMNEKRKLENSINEAITQFEEHFNNAIEIDLLTKIHFQSIDGKIATRVTVTLRIP